MIARILIILLLLCAPCWADTCLVGSDGSNYADTDCWTFPAETLESCHWKASRYQAKANGTIAYFRMRVGATPTGCTADDGCWAIYEGGTNSTLGALKAWTCFNDYDWTATGVGWHTWNVENTGTNLTVTAGQYYWIVMHSYAVDSANYASAGCSAYIGAYRGQDDAGCIATAGLDYSSGWAGEAEDQCTYASPPAPEEFNTPVQTYVMWGVWATDSQAAEASAVGVTFSGSSLQ